MSNSITTGRTSQCKNNKGGVKEVWIGSHRDIPTSQIVGFISGKITSFPTTLMVELKGQGKSLTETLNEEGGYDVLLQMSLLQQDLETTKLIGVLLKNRVFAIVIDFLENIKIIGLENGLDLDVTAQQAGQKLSFNGYRLTFKGSERNPSPFIDSFPGSGFEKEGVITGCLLASSELPSSIADLVSSCNVILS